MAVELAGLTAEPVLRAKALHAGALALAAQHRYADAAQQVPGVWSWWGLVPSVGAWTGVCEEVTDVQLSQQLCGWWVTMGAASCGKDWKLESTEVDT